MLEDGIMMKDKEEARDERDDCTKGEEEKKEQKRTEKGPDIK